MTGYKLIVYPVHLIQGVPQQIFGISFLSQMGPIKLSNWEGLVLSVSQLTGEYILSGSCKQLSKGRGITCNRTSFGGLSKLDQDFFQQNLLAEPHPMREENCQRCRMQECDDCSPDPFNMTPQICVENQLIIITRPRFLLMNL